MAVYHPWRHLRSMPEVTLGWHDEPTLDGVLFTDLDTVLLRRGMLQVDRRCALAHELAHHHLGHAGCTDRRSQRRQELEAEVVAARWLIPIEAYVTARLWSCREDEIAAELWVDLPVLWAFREGLTRSERAYVQQRLDEAQGEWGAS